MTSSRPAWRLARPVVTEIRPARRGQLLLALDGRPWRELPVEVVARMLLRVGSELDRPRLRELRRELRRAEALAVAGRALRRRDHSARSIDARLERAGVAADAREQALETLQRVGYVDDERLAERRARVLCDRGWGDAAIAADLERQGVEAGAAQVALAALEPEHERVRRIVEERGPGAKTVSYLLRRGFDEDAVGPFVADGP